VSKAPHAQAPYRLPQVAAAAPRCSAKTRMCRPCAGPAMVNGRCRMHGGTSTGARTAVGLERLRQVPFKHGRRGAEARQAARDRGQARQVLAVLEELMRQR
jgi:hypothetical protein